VSKIIMLSGSVAPAVTGLGIRLVIHGHSWGGLLLGGGLGAAMPYLITTPHLIKRLARSAPPRSTPPRGPGKDELPHGLG
jgi:hypothetical protein